MRTLKFTESWIYFITNHSVCLAMMPLPPPLPCPASNLRSNLSMSKASTLTLASKGFWYLALVNATWQPQGHHYGAIQVKEAPTVLLTMAKTWMALSSWSTLRPCLWRPQVKIKPYKLSPYCPTDHGKDLKGLIHLEANNSETYSLSSSAGSHHDPWVVDVGEAGGGDGDGNLHGGLPRHFNNHFELLVFAQLTFQG